MELAYSEVSLVLAMTFGLSGAAAHGFLSLILAKTKIDDKHLRIMDILSPIPALAMMLGLVALWFAWANPTPVVSIAAAISPISLVACFGFLIVSIVASGCYAVLSLGDRATKRSRTLLTSIAGIGGLAYVISIACVHACVPVQSWNAAAVFSSVLGASLCAGAALSAAMVENAGIVFGKGLRRATIIASFCGLLVGVLGLSRQVAVSSSWFALANYDPSFENVVSNNVVVGLFCLVASSVFCVLGIRSKDKGFYSVIAVACSLVAMFCFFLVLYTAMPL